MSYCDGTCKYLNTRKTQMRIDRRKTHIHEMDSWNRVFSA